MAMCRGDRGAGQDRGADQVGVANICAVLAEAGMTAQDIVKTNTYILDRDYVPVLAEMRKRFLGEDHRGASTTLVVSSLVRLGWLVEIDAVAIAPENSRRAK